MKTKIMKAFLIATLLGGTIGSAFATGNGTGNSPKNQKECEAVGSYWYVKDDQKIAKCWKNPPLVSGH